MMSETAVCEATCDPKNTKHPSVVISQILDEVWGKGLISKFLHCCMC